MLQRHQRKGIDLERHVNVVIPFLTNSACLRCLYLDVCTVQIHMLPGVQTGVQRECGQEIWSDKKR